MKYSPEEIEKIVLMAKSQRLKTFKIEGLEFEFAQEAYLDVLLNTANKQIPDASDGEDLLFAST